MLFKMCKPLLGGAKLTHLTPHACLTSHRLLVAALTPHLRLCCQGDTSLKGSSSLFLTSLQGCFFLEILFGFFSKTVGFFFFFTLSCAFSMVSKFSFMSLSCQNWTATKISACLLASQLLISSWFLGGLSPMCMVEESAKHLGGICTLILEFRLWLPFA